MKKLVAKAERTNGGWLIWAKEEGAPRSEWVALGTAGSIHIARAHVLALQKAPPDDETGPPPVSDAARDAMRAARAEYEVAVKERGALPKYSEEWRRAHVRACAAARRWKSIRLGLLREEPARGSMILTKGSPFGGNRAA